MRPARIVSLLFSLLVTIALWLLVAPAHLGGQLAYVAISGTSMNPRIHAGVLGQAERLRDGRDRAHDDQLVAGLRDLAGAGRAAVDDA